MAPNDEELLNFALDGEPLPEAKMAHLEQCEICQHRLASYKQVNSHLISQVYRSLCPSGTQLSFYCADLLPAVEKTRTAAHIWIVRSVKPRSRIRAASSEKCISTTWRYLIPYFRLARLCAASLPNLSGSRRNWSREMAAAASYQKKAGPVNTGLTLSTFHCTSPGPAAAHICCLAFSPAWIVPRA